MAKTRLNADRRKLALKVFEKNFQDENNIYKQKYYSTRQQVDRHYENAFLTMKSIVERTHRPDDITTLQSLKKRYGDRLDVVRPDTCFNVQVEDKYINEMEWADDDDHSKGKVKKTIKGWFPFKMNKWHDSEDYHYRNSDSTNMGYRFSFAYHHDHLKKMECMPEIYVRQKDKDNNPYKTQHEDKCIAELGIRSDNGGLANEWADKYKLNLIGTGGCHERVMPCSKDEYDILMDWQMSRQALVQSYEVWQENIIDRTNLVEKTIKQYNYVEDVLELAKASDVELQASDLELHTTDVALYNPKTVGELLQSMKPKERETRADKIARVKSYQQATIN